MLPAAKRARVGEAADIVDLNVGGRAFRVARSTLCTYPSSMLARAFDADNPIGHTTDADGRIFYCRDADLFEHVLRFLRSTRFVCPASHWLALDAAVTGPHDPTDPNQTVLEDQQHLVK